MNKCLIPILCAVGLVACNNKVEYEQVEIVGLKDCPGALYAQPLMVLMNEGDNTRQYTIVSSRENSVSLRKDKPTTWRVRVGVCGNPVTMGSYKCQQPTEFYYDQSFTYDPKAPQKIAIAQPKAGQTCVKL